MIASGFMLSLWAWASRRKQSPALAVVESRPVEAPVHLVVVQGGLADEHLDAGHDVATAAARVLDQERVLRIIDRVEHDHRRPQLALVHDPGPGNDLVSGA